MNASKLAWLLALFVVVACGSGSGDEGVPVPDRVPEVLAEPDQVALSYTVSGGIAGATVAEVIVFGDGSGTARQADGTVVDVLVRPAMLNALIVEVEGLGVHDLDLDEHPDTGLADGFGTTITVHSINGTSGVGWYGMYEESSLFDPDWVAIEEAVGSFARHVLSSTVPPDAAPENRE